MAYAALLIGFARAIFVVLGDGFDSSTVLLNPPPPLSARRLFEERSPVPNAEVYDFGLGPATVGNRPPTAPH